MAANRGNLALHGAHLATQRRDLAVHRADLAAVRRDLTFQRTPLALDRGDFAAQRAHSGAQLREIPGWVEKPEEIVAPLSRGAVERLHGAIHRVGDATLADVEGAHVVGHP